MAGALPKVTVLIATYNSSRLLRCTLESLRRQTFTDFDAWIVGDACTDDTEAVVAAFNEPRFRWTNLPTRVGSQYGPNNAGLQLAGAPLVAYLGHDDLWFPWHLGSLVEAIERVRADFVWGGVIFLGPEGPREAYGDTKIHAQVLAAPPSGWLHRRAITEPCGMWREPASEPLGVDVGFQARAFLAGFRFAPTRRMSVLKFPSSWWRSYARDAALPQEAFLTRLIADPVQLQEDVLTELVLAYARRDAPSVTLGLKSAFRGLQRRLGEWYGVERWPLAQYLRRRSARRRRQARALRGFTEQSDA